MHLDDETVERLLHGELEDQGMVAALGHLRGCPACSDGLEDARRREARVFALLDSLDERPPVRPGIAPPTGGPSWARIAAAVALVVAAGGAIALPGSPVREWISTLGSDDAEPARTRPTRPMAEVSEAGSGITVPVSGPFRIEFRTPQDSGGVRVRLGPGTDVEVRVSGEPVVFESAPDRLTIANRGSRSSYEITLPATVAPIEIRVAGRTVLQLGDRASTATSEMPEDGWRIELRP